MGERNGQENSSNGRRQWPKGVKVSGASAMLRNIMNKTRASAQALAICLVVPCGIVLVTQDGAYTLLRDSAMRVFPSLFVASNNVSEFASDLNLLILSVFELASFGAWILSAKGWPESIIQDSHQVPSGIDELHRRGATGRCAALLLCALLLSWGFVLALDLRRGEGPLCLLFAPSGVCLMMAGPNLQGRYPHLGGLAFRLAAALGVVLCLLPQLGLMGVVLQLPTFAGLALVAWRHGIEVESKLPERG
jgi:hypothetical protein